MNWSGIAPDARRERPASLVGPDTEWIIVAAKKDKDVIDLLLGKAVLEGIKIGRVLWSDDGPIKFYCCVDDFWHDQLAALD